MTPPTTSGQAAAPFGSGKLALVTGGAAGIGAGVTARLLEDGYDCATIDLRPAETESKSFHVQADVTDPDQVDAAFSTIENHFAKSVDVLVCAAGIVGTSGRIEELTFEIWKEVISVDLSGVFLCCRRAIPAMRSNGFGRIVNIASIAGKEGNPRMIPYASAKAGVIGLTKALAREVVDEGITVNAIAPGLTRTELVEAMDEETRNRLTGLIPMRRLAEVEEIATAIAYLINEATFSTGSVLDASGGRATY